MKSFTTIVLLAVTFNSPFLFGQPEGFKLISGNATSPTLENNSQLISSSNAIIEWECFSIDENETFHFLQSNDAHCVLNRVTGPFRSEILGSLHSNGKIILVNPQGLFIGPNGKIDTAGLIASSLDLSNEHFLSQNEFLFSGTSTCPVIHLGTIEARGEVFLIGPQVQNEGNIHAEHAGLAVGRSVLIRPEGAERISIQAPVNEMAGEAALSHSGLIEAIGVELKSHASAYEKAIQCSGVIDANQLEERGGEIYLVGDGGTCEVQGSLRAQGGSIHILGDRLALLTGASVDVSGKNGGGEILIGGDFQGGNPSIKNSLLTFVEKETKLCADSLEKGNGGKVIIWSDGPTHHYGEISARGGLFSGDGGFIEVSGADLNFKGLADTRAPNGKNGELLLDPINITISTTANSANVTFASLSYQGTGGTPCSPTPALIQVADIQNNLALGNVTISTNATNWSGCTDAGTITVSNAITWSAATTLTLTAAAGLVINAGISNTSSSTGFTAMNFSGNSAGTATGTFRGIDIGAVTISSAYGHITMVGRGGTTGGDHATDGIELSNTLISSTGTGALAAAISMTASAGSSASVYQHGFNQGSGTITSVDGNITIVGNGGTGAGGGFGCYFAGTISTTGTSSSTIVDVSATSGNGSATSITAVQCVGSINCANGTFSISSAVEGGTGASSFSAVSIGNSIVAPIIILGTESAGTFTIRGPTSGTSNHGVDITSSGSVGNSATTSISIAAQARSSSSTCRGINVNGAITATASGGTISLYGNATGSGNNGILVNSGKTIQSTAGSVSLRGTSQTGANGIQLASTSVVKDNTSGSVSFNTASTSAIVGLSGATITSGTGNITFGGPVSLGATQSITTASPGTITFQSTATIDGAQALTLTATSSTIALSGAIGGSTRLSSLSMTASTVNLGANISLNNSSLTFPATVLTGNSTLNTGTTGAAITFNSTVNDNGSGPFALTLQGGTGAITLSGIIGGTAPIGALSIATGASLALGENISAASLSVASGINTTLSKSGTTAITTTGASGISFAGTITGTLAGSQALTLAAGTGPITLSGAVGGTRLGAMTVSTTNNTADQGFRFDANITANSLDASGVTRTTVGTNATVNTSGNNGTIEFGGIDSISAFNRTLTLNSGSGKIWIHGAVGANQKLGTLTITSSNTTVGQGFGIGGVINLTNFSDLSLTNLTPNPITVLSSLGTAGITTTNSAISFTQTIDAQTSGSGSFTLNAGTSTISLSGAIGGTTPLGPFTCTAGTSIALPTSTKTAGGAIAINGPVPMSAAVALDSTNGGGTAAGANISITGAVTGAQALTLRAGSAGAITFGSTVGTSLTRVTTLTLTSGASLSLGGSLFLTNSVAIPMATTLTGNAEINTGL